MLSLNRVFPIVFLVSSALSQGPTQCKSVPGELNCVCQLDDGQYISLLGLANANRSPRFVDTGTDGFIYSYNPCYGVAMDVETGLCTGDDKMAACQQSGDKSAAYGIGTMASETIFKNTDGSYYITYENGQGGRGSRVNLVCKSDAKDTIFDAEGEEVPNSGQYIFTITSNQVCPSTNITRPTIKPPPPRSGSGGKGSIAPGLIGIGVILIAMAVLVTYFIVGVIINIVMLKKNGTEVIPQKGLWFSLPGLIKDGVLFTFKPLIRLIKRDYEPLA